MVLDGILFWPVLVIGAGPMDTRDDTGLFLVGHEPDTNNSNTN